MKNATCTTHSTEANKAFPRSRFYCTLSKSEVWVLKLNKTHNTQFHRPIVFKYCMFFKWNAPSGVSLNFQQAGMKQTAPSGVSLNFQCIGNGVHWVSSRYKTHILSHNSHATSSFLLMVTSLNETPTGTGLTVLRNHPHGPTKEATL
jgi:hypothetical protein